MKTCACARTHAMLAHGSSHTHVHMCDRAIGHYRLLVSFKKIQSLFLLSFRKSKILAYFS